MFFACFFFYCFLCTGLIVAFLGQSYKNDEVIHKKYAKVLEKPTAFTSSIKPENWIFK
jgi:hypothetical protein